MKHTIVFALLCLVTGTGLAQNPIPHPAVFVSLDRSDYALGELLEITLHNPTDGSIVFSQDPPYLIRFQDTGLIVYQSTLTVIHVVSPHTEPLYFYDTSDFDAGLISPGTYEVVFRWIDTLDPQLIYETIAAFELDTVITGTDPDWGGVKAIFDR